MTQIERRYPVGIQTFSEIIQGGYVYVDKTDLMWQLQNASKFIFLSRPRRFGKSLLTSTFHSFFDGEKKLFEGLKVMQLEKEWIKYPVLHFDISRLKYKTVSLYAAELNRQMQKYEEEFGSNPAEATPGMKLAGIIERAWKKTGRRVVVIVDEYDAPLLEHLHEDEQLKEVRAIMQEFYQQLKAGEEYIRFCFITGITKFSQLSIFSTINNLTNISMVPKFAAICGITEEELITTLKEDIEILAEKCHCSAQQMHEQLKTMYDGYRFSEESPEIYNPFSLLKAFAMEKVGSYWFESGTPTFLIHQLERFQTDITTMDSIEADAIAFDQPTDALEDALPLLYQAGYLTIKDYDATTEMYTLALPNKEVRTGLIRGLIPRYLGLNSRDAQGFAVRLWKALRVDDIEQALQEMKSYLASLPYVEGFKKKLEDPATREGFYEYTFYLIFSMLNLYARTQVKSITGRIDMVVKMPSTLYVFEFKVDGTAQEALEQIDTRGYAIPYQAGERRIVKVGVSFSSSSRTIENWMVK